MLGQTTDSAGCDLLLVGSIFFAGHGDRQRSSLTASLWNASRIATPGYLGSIARRLRRNDRGGASLPSGTLVDDHPQASPGPQHRHETDLQGIVTRDFQLEAP